MSCYCTFGDTLQQIQWDIVNRPKKTERRDHIYGMHLFGKEFSKLPTQALTVQMLDSVFAARAAL